MSDVAIERGIENLSVGAPNKAVIHHTVSHLMSMLRVLVQVTVSIK